MPWGYTSPNCRIFALAASGDSSGAAARRVGLPKLPPKNPQRFLDFANPLPLLIFQNRTPPKHPYIVERRVFSPSPGPTRPALFDNRIPLVVGPESPLRLLRRSSVAILSTFPNRCDYSCTRPEDVHTILSTFVIIGEPCYRYPEIAHANLSIFLAGHFAPWRLRRRSSSFRFSLFPRATLCYTMLHSCYKMLHFATPLLHLTDAPFLP